ncbi:MAG: DUF6515 family protein [Candidatus Omnitrophota bacterium]|jgi:hypothetical protein
MLKQGLRSIIMAAIISAVILAFPFSDTFAQEERGGGPRNGGGHNEGNRGRDGEGRHYYRNGNWYRHGWLGLDIIVSALAVGAIIDSLPPRYNTVVVGNTPYYYYDNYYYRPYQYGGYIVVPPPVATPPVVIMPQAAPAAVTTISTAQIQEQIQGAITVNIPNSQGGYTAVTLKRSGNGFVGPQGEYYPNNPTVEQLKILYGK